MITSEITENSDDTYVRPTQVPPSRAVQLAMTSAMGFVKGAVISAFVVLPFFGLWVAAGTAVLFAGFCLSLALWRGPCHTGNCKETTK